MNLHFGKSKKLPTYRKTTLLPINSIYLVLSSLEIQRSMLQDFLLYVERNDS